MHNITILLVITQHSSPHGVIMRPLEVFPLLFKDGGQQATDNSWRNWSFVLFKTKYSMKVGDWISEISIAQDTSSNCSICHPLLQFGASPQPELRPAGLENCPRAAGIAAFTNFMHPVFPALWSQYLPKSLQSCTKHTSELGLNYTKKLQQPCKNSLRKTNFKTLSGGCLQLHQIGIPYYHLLSHDKYIENESEWNLSKLGRKLGLSEISNVMKFCCERPNGSENIAEKQGAQSSWKDL